MTSGTLAHAPQRQRFYVGFLVDGAAALLYDGLLRDMANHVGIPLIGKTERMPHITIKSPFDETLVDEAESALHALERPSSEAYFGMGARLERLDREFLVMPVFPSDGARQVIDAVNRRLRGIDDMPFHPLDDPSLRYWHVTVLKRSDCPRRFEDICNSFGERDLPYSKIPVDGLSVFHKNDGMTSVRTTYGI